MFCSQCFGHNPFAQQLYGERGVDAFRGRPQSRPLQMAVPYGMVFFYYLIALVPAFIPAVGTVAVGLAEGLRAEEGFIAGGGRAGGNAKPALYTISELQELIQLLRFLQVAAGGLLHFLFDRDERYRA